MSLSERLQTELVPAMKAKERTRGGVIRMIKAALKNKEIEKGKSILIEEENQILQTMVKQRNESIEQFEKGGRSDLAKKEAEEKELIQAYLPEASRWTRSSALPSRSSRKLERARPRIRDAS